MDRASIEELARVSSLGDREALLELCAQIVKSVLYRVLRRVRGTQDAEDVAQEVLFRVCDKIHTLREPKAFNGWLNRIIINETNNYMAKSAVPVTVVSIEDYMDVVPEKNDAFQPDTYVVREEDRKMLLGIIDGLPERQLEAVTMFYYEGLSVTETAAAMDITKQAVRRYLALAREKMKKEIQKQYKQAGAAQYMAMLSAGTLLPQILTPGAEAAPVNAEWMAQAMNNCNTFIANMPETAATVGGSAAILKTLGVRAGVSVLTGTLLIGGLALAGVFDRLRIPPAAAEAVGTVVFSGGEAAHAHLNPTGARPQTSSTYGELTVNGFMILPAEGEKVLYSGGEGETETALRELREEGADGEYLLIYSLEDSLGEQYTLRCNFVMRHNPS